MAATLLGIKEKVRLLTRSPSIAQLTDEKLTDYINTFILYDFPEHLRIFTFNKTLTFYTTPYEDVYETSDDVNSPLYNFRNIYTSVMDPVYIAGFKAWYQQSRETFFRQYPFLNAIADTNLRGNGALPNFTGTLSATPVLKGHVLFGTTNTAGVGLQLHDNRNGVLTGDGNGTINYTTGVYELNFSSAPADGAVITSETVPYQASRPSALLFFDNKFTIRPVPDKVYPINIEVFQRPTAMMENGEVPELEQWWQYIAYGAAKKVLEDRMDMESVQMIMPEFKTQETLVLRRTIMLNGSQQSSTIYNDMINGAYREGWGPWFY